MEEARRPESALISPSPEGVSIEIAVHDATRFEWRVSVPLPDERRLAYSVDTEFEVPSSAVSTRSPWDQLQGITRLESPEGGAGGAAGSPPGGEVCHRVLSFQQKLRWAREGLVRHCRRLQDGAGTLKEEEAQGLLIPWLETAIGSFAQARASLSGGPPEEPDEAARERALADEFLSLRWLDFLAEARSLIEVSLAPLAGEHPRFQGLVGQVDGQLAEALDGELEYRRSKGYLIAEAEVPATLERYVERGGRLKKHFEAALALDREVQPVDDWLKAWFTSVAAIVAGACAFILQMLIVKAPSGLQWGWGIGGLAVLTGLTYAMRERIKEVSRSWLTGRVYRYYAQRIVRCRRPNEGPRPGPVVLEAREWCNETTTSRPDPISPESGASRRATVVNHIHRGFLTPQPEVRRSGVLRIRQIFRYDLSPLFPRLQDPVKRVPVVDPRTNRSRFVDAPRRYQVPVRVMVEAAGEKRERQATIVVDKLGIVRLEPGTGAPAPRASAE